MKPPATLSAWFNGSLINIRGSSDLEFTTAGPAVFRTKDVLLTNTQTSIEKRRNHFGDSILRKHQPQSESSNLAGVQLLAGNSEDTSAWLQDLEALL